MYIAKVKNELQSRFHISVLVHNRRELRDSDVWSGFPNRRSFDAISKLLDMLSPLEKDTQVRCCRKFPVSMSQIITNNND